MARSLETDILIDAPPDEVWRILSDFARYPEWNPFIVSISGAAKPGRSLRVTLEPPGRKPMTFRPVVKSAVPGREFRWLGRMFVPGIFDGHHQFVLEDTDQGTRFVHRESFSGLLAGFVLRTMGEAIRKGFIQMNEALKERAEQGEGAAPDDHGADPDEDGDG